MKRELILLIVEIIFKFYGWACFWNFLFFWKQFRQYDKIYETLKDRKYYLCKEGEAVLGTPLFTENMIVWRYKRNSFALKLGVFLFDSPIHYINSPYSLYWLWRYKKWFRENLDLSQLEEKKI